MGLTTGGTVLVKTGKRQYNKNMDKKTKIWILVLAAVCLLGLAAFGLGRKGTAGKQAVITVDGETVEEVDLSRVKEPYDIPIDTPWGHNTVHVEPGAISVTEADCPDQICVQMGRLTQGGIPIVCMPHRLVITLEGSGIDG